MTKEESQGEKVCNYQDNNQKIIPANIILVDCLYMNCKGHWLVLNWWMLISWEVCEMLRCEVPKKQLPAQDVTGGLWYSSWCYSRSMIMSSICINNFCTIINGQTWNDWVRVDKWL